MATTGSLLGTYAPQMQEPYQIETNLADRATGGSAAMANTLLGQYWLERQMREGQYADRMANQMQFGQQQLHAQLLDQNMKALSEGAKTPGLLQMYASSPQYAGIFSGMDPNAIANAVDLTQAQGRANIVQAAGRGLAPMAMAGYNIPMPDVSAVTGLPNVTQGTAVPVQAAQINAAGRIAAAQARGAASGGPTWTYTASPNDVGGVLQTKGRGQPPPGYGVTLPPPPASSAPASVTSAPAVTPSTGPNKAAPPPPNYSKLDAQTNQYVQAGVEKQIKAANPTMYKDIVSGYVGNKPDSYTDGKGNVVVRGRSGNLYGVGKPATPDSSGG